jgi:glycosyltransferase involved in cell wall biosynthesis
LIQSASLSEIIVVSDGDENCSVACARFEHVESVSLYQTNAPGGAYRARNVGLQCAKGSIISFCDSDDTWSVSRALEVESQFTSWSNIVNTYHNRVNEQGEVTSTSTETLGGVFSYTREMVDRLGGFKDWTCSADSDFYYRALRAGGVRTISPTYSYNYRIHGGQLTQSRRAGLSSRLRKSYESRWGSGPLTIRPRVPSYRRLF